MTAIKLINETVAYYSKDVTRRGICKISGSCEYLTRDGKMCAVGRCVKEELNSDLSGSFNNLYNENKPLSEQEREDLFKDEYKGIPAGLWSNLQSLHDTNRFWNATGLSKDGKNFVKILKREFKGQ